MKELEFINIIKKQTNSQFIGDDCAYIKDLNIVITQDNFVEDVHFKKEWATPYQIGYKAAAVNISDILASGAEPKYLSIGLSLPNVETSFIEDFYKGVEAASNGAIIVGGDITGSDKIFISITAIGSTLNRKISSRSFAKPGYIVISNGSYGKSAKGLRELLEGKSFSENIKEHLEPSIDCIFSKEISTQIEKDYAMMDTSDGLADALFKIAESSNVTIKTPLIEGMFEAEDYNLVAAVPKDILPYISNYNIIGKVKEYCGYYLEIAESKFQKYNELGLYNHFGEKND